MFGLMLVTHGGLAEEFLKAAANILGEDQTRAVPLSIEWNLESTRAKDLIRRKLKEIQRENDQVLILTDLFGGTPTNLSMTFFEPGKVEILTGTNLPMFIKALMLMKGDMPLEELVATLKAKGQGAIVAVSEVMNHSDRNLGP